jgi:hypothetical protein
MASTYRAWKYSEPAEYTRQLQSINRAKLLERLRHIVIHVSVFIVVPLVFYVYQSLLFDTEATDTIVNSLILWGPVQHTEYGWIALTPLGAPIAAVYLCTVVLIWTLSASPTLVQFYIKIFLVSGVWTTALLIWTAVYGIIHENKEKKFEQRKAKHRLTEYARLNLIYETTRLPAGVVEIVEGFLAEELKPEPEPQFLSWLQEYDEEGNIVIH